MAFSPIRERLRALSQATEPKYTQGWLARQLGIDRSTLYGWLHGRWEIPEPRRQAIAALLDMPLEDVRPDYPHQAAA